MSGTLDRRGGDMGPDPLVEDLRATLRERAAPPEFARRLHEAVDAGAFDPPAHRRRRRWLAAAAVAAGVALASLLGVSVLRDTDRRLRARAVGDAPLTAALHVQAIEGDGSAAAWLDDGGEVASGSWLRIRVETPPGVHVTLIRSGPGAAREVFYRWPRSGRFRAREDRDGDVWYAVDLPPGELRLVALVSHVRLGGDEVDAALADGDLAGVAVRVESMTLRVIE